MFYHNLRKTFPVVSLLRRANQLLASNRQLSNRGLLERKNLVEESIDQSLKPEIWRFPETDAVAATSAKQSLEDGLATLRKTWTQLLLTYGISVQALNDFLHTHSENVAECLPQCKRVVAKRMYNEWVRDDSDPILTEELVDFAKERGVLLDPIREPHEYPELHQLIIDYGKTMCDKYPVIFRDLYIINRYTSSQIFKAAEKQSPNITPSSKIAKMSTLQNCDKGMVHSERSSCRYTLTEYLKNDENISQWYCFGDFWHTQLWEIWFEVIRSFEEKPFDPISQTDDIDPEVQIKAWEKAGLFFGAETEVRLEVEMGTVGWRWAPSPVT